MSTTRNPFRSRASTPNSTGTSTPSNAPSYHSGTPAHNGMSSASAPPSYHSALETDPHSDDEEPPEALPDLTPRVPSVNPQFLLAQSTASSTSAPTLPPRHPPQNQLLSTAPPSLPRRPSPSPAPTPPPSSPSPIDDLLFGLPPDSLLPESAPPAYSPTPNVRGGESVVEQGPRRPFQRAPEPLIQLPVPSRQERSPAPTPSPPQRPRYQPPRAPPPSQLPIPTPERPLSQMSDFARDFYSAGTTPSPSETPAREEQEREPRPRQPRYAPPPGAPPPRRPRAASTSSGAGSTAPSVSDGRPTTTPTPGHPLLRNGQTLVYPEGYTCPKCVSRSPVPSRFACSPTRSLAYPRHPCTRRRYQGQNTGYKNFDPSHPCRKCWDRFGKPLTSVIASSPWGEQGGAAAASQSSRGRSFQRPLPTFNPPQRRIEPSMPGAYPNSPCSSSQPRTNAPVMAMPAGPVPPPGSTVVNPGDPRIGGRLCWRCGGRGVTPFLIFEEMTCETCGGIGRLLN